MLSDDRAAKSYTACCENGTGSAAARSQATRLSPERDSTRLAGQSESLALFRGPCDIPPMRFKNRVTRVLANFNEPKHRDSAVLVAGRGECS